jgi:hypothetical protein
VNLLIVPLPVVRNLTPPLPAERAVSLHEGYARNGMRSVDLFPSGSIATIRMR